MECIVNSANVMLQNYAERKLKKKKMQENRFKNQFLKIFYFKIKTRGKQKYQFIAIGSIGSATYLYKTR